MRFVFAAMVSLCLAISALAQQPSASLFDSARPDATLVITKHPSTADMVEVTMLAPGYPKTLLQSQCEMIGQLVGVPVRGLIVATSDLSPSNPRLSFLKATFATNGLSDSAGLLHIEPILKAFAGAPEPFEVHLIDIVFAGHSPTPKTVQHYSKPGIVEGDARAASSPPSVEYMIELKTQDIAKIEFPASADAIPAPVAKKPREGVNLRLVFGLLGVAALGTGALVYLAFSRSSNRGLPK